MEETVMNTGAPESPAAEAVVEQSAESALLPGETAGRSGPAPAQPAAPPASEVLIAQRSMQGGGSHPAQQPLMAPTDLMQELYTLRGESEDRALLADPARGAAYAQLRGQVQQLMSHCRSAGSPISTEAAFGAVLLREFPTLATGAADTARRTALAAVAANAQASPGPLGAAAAPAAPDFENMSSEEFAQYHRRALHGGWD